MRLGSLIGHRGLTNIKKLQTWTLIIYNIQEQYIQAQPKRNLHPEIVRQKAIVNAVEITTTIETLPFFLEAHHSMASPKLFQSSKKIAVISRANYAM